MLKYTRSTGRISRQVDYLYYLFYLGLFGVTKLRNISTIDERTKITRVRDASQLNINTYYLL